MGRTIAWLSAETPGIDGGGGRRRQFHQIRVLLERGIGVHVATLEGPQDDSGLRELCPVVRFPARRFGSSRELRRFLEQVEPERAVVAHVESLPHVRRALRGIPFLLDFHNVNSRWHAAHGEEQEASRWRQREQDALRAATSATACSAEEARALGGGAEVAGHGIAPDEWPEAALAAHRAPAAALFGAWDHRPNAEAGRWLAAEIWPAVLAAVPDARLVLAGPGEPPAELLALPGVEHVGRAESLAALLGGVRVALVPIRGGIGARVKFGEALASGAAVVSTSEGAEGFEAEGAFARADGAAEFAEVCVALLREEERARELGDAGRCLALTRLTWERTTEPIVRFAENR